MLPRILRGPRFTFWRFSVYVLASIQRRALGECGETRLQRLRLIEQHRFDTFQIASIYLVGSLDDLLVQRSDV